MNHSSAYPSMHLFSGGTRPLTGGIPCRAHVENDRPKFGTLGYIATKTSNGEQVMLSCAHVLFNLRISERLVFQPDYSKCTGVYYHDVGTAAEHRVNNYSVAGSIDRYFIDAAIATVNSGVGTRRFIPNVGDITGSENIIGVTTLPPRVKKMGAASGYTEGVVSSVTASQGRATNLIKIDPLAGHTYTYRERRMIDPNIVANVLVDFPAQAFNGTATLVDTGQNIVEFQSEVFGIPGDSGAQIVKDGKIIGMLVGGDMFEARAFNPDTQSWGIVGIPKGSVYACHIQPVLDQLGLRIDPSQAATSGKPLVVPGNLLAAEDPDKYTRLSEKLEIMERHLNRSEAGRNLLQLIRTHFLEVANLVHHTRPVKVTWHRHYGPAFVAAFFRCVAEPDQAMPHEVEGVPVPRLFKTMEQAFTDYGSSALYAAMRQYRHVVDLFIGSPTLNHFLTGLENLYQPQRS